MNLVECVKTFTVFYSVNHKIATCLFLIFFEEFINNFGMSMMLAMKLVDPTRGLRHFNLAAAMHRLDMSKIGCAISTSPCQICQTQTYPAC